MSLEHSPRPARRQAASHARGAREEVGPDGRHDKQKLPEAWPAADPPLREAAVSGSAGRSGRAPDAGRRGQDAGDGRLGPASRVFVFGGIAQRCSPLRPPQQATGPRKIGGPFDCRPNHHRRLAAPKAPAAAWQRQGPARSSPPPAAIGRTLKQAGADWHDLTAGPHPHRTAHDTIAPMGWRDVPENPNETMWLAEMEVQPAPVAVGNGFLPPPLLVQMRDRHVEHAHGEADRDPRPLPPQDFSGRGIADDHPRRGRSPAAAPLSRRLPEAQRAAIEAFKERQAERDAEMARRARRDGQAGGARTSCRSGGPS